MAVDLWGEDFFKPIEEASRIKSNESRSAYEQQRTKDLPALDQARIAAEQGKLQYMNANLGLAQQRLAEMIREFNVRQNNLEKGIGVGGQGRGSTMMQAQNDVMSIAQQYGALDPKSGKIDMSKIPPFLQQRIQEDLSYVQKQSGGSLAQKRILQFSNALSTFGNVDISPLQYYSGRDGHAKLKRDQAVALTTGTVPQELQKYNTLVNTVIPLGAEQIGQAFGGSVQKEASDIRNNALYNKDQWTNSPEQVADQWNSVLDIANSELNNARAQLTNPEFAYTGVNTVGVNPLENAPGETSNTTVSPTQNAMGMSTASPTDIATGAAFLANKYNKSIKDAVKVFNSLNPDQQKEILSEANNGT